MPLISIHDICSDVRLGLWKMSEDLTDSIPYYQDAAQLFRSVERQKEYVCVRLLLEKIIGREVEITHNENGKPMLKGGRTCQYQPY